MIRSHRFTASLLAVAFVAIAVGAAAQDASDPTARLVIRVEDAAHHPIPSIKIQLAGPNDTTASGASDGKGLVRFATLPAGNYSATASLSREQGWRAEPYGGIVVRDDRATEFFVTLAPVAALDVYLYDPHGAPVAGASVMAFPKEWAKDMGPMAVTDKTGHAAFDDLPLGDFDVFANGPDASWEPIHHEMTLKQGVNVEKLQFAEAQPAPASLHGRVTAGGVGVPGARVELTSGEDQEWTWTDKDGAYGFEQLTPGSYDLDVTAPKGLADQRIRDLDIKGDTTRDVALAPSGLLAGMVRDARGEPIHGAEVALWDETGDGGSATTDEEGRYLVELPEGVYAMQIDAEGYAPYGAENVSVRAGKLASHDAELQDAAHALHGKALANGHVAPHVLVVVIHRDADGRVDLVTSNVTGADGLWRFDALPEGSYTVIGILAGAHTLVTADVAGTQTEAPDLVFTMVGGA